MRFQYYHEPSTIKECVEMLTHYGPEGRVLAGGTDLVPKLRSRELRPKAIISLGTVRELTKHEKHDDGSLKIGAMVTLAEVSRCSLLGGGYDLIRQGAGHVSSMQVRNVATLGGNSCNAAPSADTVPGLIAAEVRAIIAGPGGERTVALEDFFEGPGKTGLGIGEMLVGFHVPALPSLTGGSYKKYAIRGDTDLAIVGVAVRLTLDEKDAVRHARIVMGAVGPTPLRARRAEHLLLGQQLNKEVLEELGHTAAGESTPINDQRATAGYRKEMIRVWTQHATWEAFERALTEKAGKRG